MSEFEIDRERFGIFLAGERKRLGITQRELAQRLYISDKAVSKWERGLSLPDVSLLIPLAKALGVTVTELLEGRRLESETGMEMERVERLVKRTLTMTEKAPEEGRKNRGKRAVLWFVCVAAALLEIAALLRLGWFPGEAAWTLAGLSCLFGFWVWLGAKERLPAYYDENPISFYSDGIFKLSMPGVAFNNGNWPRILWSLRVWTAAGMLLSPALSAAGRLLPAGRWRGVEQYILLILFLGGMFLPVYILGRRRPKDGGEK